LRVGFGRRPFHVISANETLPVHAGVSGQALVDGTLVAEAEVSAVIVET
jgi:hypothetical protein